MKLQSLIDPAQRAAERGDDQRAASLYEAALDALLTNESRLDPKEQSSAVRSVAFNLAQVLNRLRRYRDALESVEVGMARNPSSVGRAIGLAAKGEALCGLKQLREGLAMFHEAVLAHPITGRLNSAESMLRIGDPGLLDLAAQWIELAASELGGQGDALQNKEIDGLRKRLVDARRAHPIVPKGRVPEEPVKSAEGPAGRPDPPVAEDAREVKRPAVKAVGKNPMKPSPSVKVIWRLAASEMAAGQFKEIEPEHFCMGILKFAELSVKALRADDDHAELAKAVAAEAKLVHEALQKCGIESTSARRKLRGQLGNGDTPQQEGQAHRSAASRALFESAADLAHETESDTITPLHLLTAIVQSPTPAIVQTLPGLAVPRRIETPLLNKWGEDLVEVLEKGDLNTDSDRSAECKAILHILAQKKCVFLVSDNSEATKATLAWLAKILSREGGLSSSNAGRRLIRLTVQHIWEVEKRTMVAIPPDVLREAAASPNVIVVCPFEDMFPSCDKHSKAVSRLAEVPLCCVIPLSSARCQSLVEADPGWRKLAKPVWVRDEARKSIPKEL